MKVKIIRHFTAHRNNPAVEYERVTLWGEVERGKCVTDGLEGQALIEQIEKDGVIADKFSMSGEVVDEIPYGSLAWRMNAEAGTLRGPPWTKKRDDAEQFTPSKPPKPNKPKKVNSASSSTSAPIQIEAPPMHAQGR